MRPARLTVVLVAHGSRDPRAAASTEALARAVRRAHPSWAVRATYLDHAGPRPLDVLARSRRAVLVPLLLTSAYHGRVDLPAILRAAASLPVAVTATDVLGPASPLLLAALERRLVTAAQAACFSAVADAARFSAAAAEAACFSDAAQAACFSAAVPGAEQAACPDLGPAALKHPSAAGPSLDAVVLAAAGTRDDAARATVADAAAALGERMGLPSAVAYASGPGPRADEAVASLRAAGAKRVGVAAYFLAPGLLYDSAMQAAQTAGAVATAEPLGDAPELVALIGARVTAGGSLQAAA